MLTLAFKDCNTIIILRIIWTSLRNEAATMNTLETAQTHITRFTSHPRPAHPGRPVALRVSRQPRAAGETPAVRTSERSAGLSIHSLSCACWGR